MGGREDLLSLPRVKPQAATLNPLGPAQQPLGFSRDLLHPSSPRWAARSPLHLRVPKDDSKETVMEKGPPPMCFHFSCTTKPFPGIWVQLQAEGALVAVGEEEEDRKQGLGFLVPLRMCPELRRALALSRSGHCS